MAEFTQRRLHPGMLVSFPLFRARGVHVSGLRPSNYTRTLFHIGSALVAAVTIEVLSSPMANLLIAIAWATFAWGSEGARRLSPTMNTWLMRLFGKVIHADEKARINSATWYATALVLLALTQSIVLCVVGVIVLGIGDPLAALVGRRFGRTKLVHGRSLEGTLAFFVSASIAVFVVLAVLHSSAFSLSSAAVLAASGAAAGAVAELVSLHIDDNFSVPLSAAAGVVVASWVVSVAV